MEKAVTGAVILKKYFGLKDGQKLQEFAAEIRELTPEDKEELVRLAAEELGVEVSK